MVQILQNFLPDFLLGFRNTIIASALALIFALLIGVIMGVLQVSEWKFLRGLANVYVELFRNIPLLVIVMFFYIVIPMYVVNITGFTAGVIGLAIYTSAFIADNVRAGINTVPRGQLEAAMAHGLTYSQAMRMVILPQATRIVLPPLGNQVINLVKNSSILTVVAGFDLMYFGDVISQTTFDTFNTYIIVGLFYLLLTIPLTLLVQHLERKYGTIRR